MVTELIPLHALIGQDSFSINVCHQQKYPLGYRFHLTPGQSLCSCLIPQYVALAIFELQSSLFRIYFSHSNSRGLISAWLPEALVQQLGNFIVLSAPCQLWHPFPMLDLVFEPGLNPFEHSLYGPQTSLFLSIIQKLTKLALMGQPMISNEVCYTVLITLSVVELGTCHIWVWGWNSQAFSFPTSSAIVPYLGALALGWFGSSLYLLLSAMPRLFLWYFKTILSIVNWIMWSQEWPIKLPQPEMEAPLKELFDLADVKGSLQKDTLLPTLGLHTNAPPPSHTSPLRMRLIL